MPLSLRAFALLLLYHVLKLEKTQDCFFWLLLQVNHPDCPC